MCKNALKCSSEFKANVGQLKYLFTEGTFRFLKYEEVYLDDHKNMEECRKSLKNYFRFFNEERVYQALG